ncbi:MAG: Do family serine endopeptidase [Verrucomicrobiaceae bacterium]|nr:Do family serine endopeptidase [Verrucomicrobiaceae bacterium]
MKTPRSLTTTISLAALLATGAVVIGESKPEPSHRIKSDDFVAKLHKDTTPLPAGGSMPMSYASVVDKVLPSVVTISVASSTPAHEPSMDDIPPQMQPFFRRFFGLPEDGDSDPFERRRDPRDEKDQGDIAPGPRGRDRAPSPAPQRRHPTPTGVGSGVIVTPDGYVMTNNHVIENADEIKVSVVIDGRSKEYVATVVGADPPTDVALLKIDGKDLPAATIGDSASLRVGDVVLAAGAPMELDRSVTMGIISALSRNNRRIEGDKSYEDFIQTDASINPGNSGGPLVDSLGRVIGINTAILSRSGMNAGIGFTIPINMVIRIVEDLVDDGAVQRGFLGVQISDVNEEVAGMMQLKDHGGAVVMLVGGDSPADKAGVEVGDVIVSAAGKRVDGSAALRLIVSAEKPGSTIPLEIIRDDKRMTLNAVLEALPDSALAGGDSERGVPKGKKPGPEPIEIVPGLEAQPMSPALRNRFKLPADIEGLVVTKVAENSRAASMGIQAGDVIEAVNKMPVTTLEDAQKLTKDNSRATRLRIYRDGDTMLVIVPLEDN